MDLLSSLCLRELGFGSNFPDLNKILSEKAEIGLIDSNFHHKNVKFPSDYSKATYLIVTSPDGRYLASSHGDHNVYVTEITSGKVVHTLHGHPRTPWALAFHPDRSDLLASGCLAGQARVWDLKTGCCEKLIVDAEHAVASLSFHPESRLLAIAICNKVYFWDWKDYKPWGETCANANERVRFVKFDRSGSMLYTAITNVETNLERPSRNVAPPEIMPYRCHELLRSRSELLEMRAELSARHEMLQQRYNDLLGRYNGLRSQYPDLAPNEQAQSTGTNDGAPLRPPLPPPSLPTNTDRSLSPIRLERLDDAVGYAHHLTQTSMQQFLEFHQNSMASLQRSYMQLSHSASTLVSNFRRTYDDMYRLQEQIDRRLGLIPAHTAYIRPARALLQALTRMQEILMHRAQLSNNEPDDQGQPLDRETTTLVQLFDSLLENIGERVPTEISDLLRQSRTRVTAIRERSESSISLDQIDGLQTELTNEIQNFQSIIRRWKARVVNCLRGGDSSRSDDPGPSSSGFVRLSLSPGARNSASEPNPDSRPSSTAAQSTESATDAFVMPSDTNRDTQEKKIGNITISPMKRRATSTSTEQTEDQPSTSGASSYNLSPRLQGRVNINLSPSRAQPVASPNQNLTLRLNFEPSGVPATKRRRLDFGTQTDARTESGTSNQEDNTATEALLSSEEALSSGSARTRPPIAPEWRLPFHRRPRSTLAGERPSILHDLTVRNLADRRLEDTRTAQRRLRLMELDQEESAYDLHRAINRAIAGAFIGTGDVAIANNIMNFTCRIQEWKFGPKELPNLLRMNDNVLVKRCKLHNDGSIAISSDGQMLTCFSENLATENPVWADTLLQIFSLRSFDKGVVLFQKNFGPNAISISMSPTDTHIMVGLAARRYLRLRHSPETFAQVYRLCNMDGKDLSERDLKLVLNLNRDLSQLPSGSDDFMALFAMRNCSLNCATWLPNSGQGFTYGTNRGHLYLITPNQGGDRPDQPLSDDTNQEERTADEGIFFYRRPFLRRQARIDLFDSNL